MKFFLPYQQTDLLVSFPNVKLNNNHFGVLYLCKGFWTY
jgi:hypothetical protein